MTESATTMRRRRWWAVGALFFALLWLSPLQTLLHFAPEPKRSENRKLADAPRWPSRWEAVVPALRQTDAWFNDRFGFRKTLVLAHHVARLRLFGISPVTKVIVGEEGWLYLAPRGADPATQLGRPFTPAELDAWTRGLEARQDALAAHGIRFVLMIAPDKATVYPEFLPRRIREAPVPSRIVQLAEHLAGHSRVEQLDLRPALLAAKAEQRLFHRTDNHWNALGGHAAYRALIGRLGAHLPVGEPRPLSAFRIERETTPGMNLARMLAMGALFEEELLRLKPLEPHALQSVPVWRAPGRLDRSARAFEQPGTGLPRALLLHDSFGDALVPLLAPHFSRLLLVRSRTLPLQRVLAEKPDVVILEMGAGALERGRLN